MCCLALWQGPLGTTYTALWLGYASLHAPGIAYLLWLPVHWPLLAFSAPRPGGLCYYDLHGLTWALLHAKARLVITYWCVK